MIRTQLKNQFVVYIEFRTSPCSNRDKLFDDLKTTWSGTVFRCIEWWFKQVVTSESTCLCKHSPDSRIQEILKTQYNFAAVLRSLCSSISTWAFHFRDSAAAAVGNRFLCFPIKGTLRLVWWCWSVERKILYQMRQPRFRSESGAPILPLNDPLCLDKDPKDVLEQLDSMFGNAGLCCLQRDKDDETLPNRSNWA